jgi:hypothetical protein
MTAAFVVAIYLLALACFLGLDIFGKTIPPTGYGRVAGALGAMSAVALLVGMQIEAGDGAAYWARGAGLFLASAAAAGSIASLWQRRGAASTKVVPPAETKAGEP